MKFVVLGGILIIAGIVAIFGLMFFPAEGGKMLLIPQNERVVAEGQAIYAEHCASCHGKRLEGQANWRERRADGHLPAPPHDQTGHTWHHPDQMLIDLTKHGPAKVIGDPNYKSDMPAYEGVLSDDEIVAVLSFIKSTWPKSIQSRHDEINRQSAGN